MADGAVTGAAFLLMARAAAFGRTPGFAAFAGSGVGVAATRGVVLGAGAALGDVDVLGDGVAVALADGVALGDGLAVADGEALGDVLGDGVGVAACAGRLVASASSASELSRATLRTSFFIDSTFLLFIFNSTPGRHRSWSDTWSVETVAGRPGSGSAFRPQGCRSWSRGPGRGCARSGSTRRTGSTA